MNTIESWVEDTVASLSDIISSPVVTYKVSDHSLTRKVAPLLVNRKVSRVAIKQPTSMSLTSEVFTNLYFFDDEKRKRRGHY
jgi:hypothetical protein